MNASQVFPSGLHFSLLQTSVFGVGGVFAALQDCESEEREIENKSIGSV
jgi:hypothetical protein